MKRNAAFALSLLVISGCATPGQPQAQAETKPPYSHRPIINLLDGCNKDEARLLAKRYFKRRFGEGMEGGMMDGGETEKDWVFNIIVGYAGAHEGDILVSKMNGFVRYEPK